MTSTKRFAVDDLINIPAQQLAINEILKGTFNDEIAQITKLRDDLAKQQTIAKTVEQAQALLADAKAKQDEATKYLAASKAQADKIVADAYDQMSQAKQARDDAAAAQAKVILDRAALDTREKDLVALKTALDAREQNIVARLANVQQIQNQLNQDRAAFNKKLESLKV